MTAIMGIIEYIVRVILKHCHKDNAEHFEHNLPKPTIYSGAPQKDRRS